MLALSILSWLVVLGVSIDQSVGLSSPTVRPAVKQVNRSLDNRSYGQRNYVRHPLKEVNMSLRSKLSPFKISQVPNRLHPNGVGADYEGGAHGGAGEDDPDVKPRDGENDKLLVDAHSNIELKLPLNSTNGGGMHMLPLRFSRTPSVVAQHHIGSSAKHFVSGVAALVILLNPSAQPIYYVLGGVANSYLSKLLKVIIRQPRPPQPPFHPSDTYASASASASSSSRPEPLQPSSPGRNTRERKGWYGMPSSHAQAIFFFAAVLCWKLLLLRSVDLQAALRVGGAVGMGAGEGAIAKTAMLLCKALGIASLLGYSYNACIWRVKTGLHTAAQSLVGAAVGTLMGVAACMLQPRLLPLILTASGGGMAAVQGGGGTSGGGNGDSRAVSGLTGVTTGMSEAPLWLRVLLAISGALVLYRKEIAAAADALSRPLQAQPRPEMR